MLLPAMASASGFPAILSINMSPVITAAMNEPSVLPQEVVRTSSSLQNAAQTWGERNAVFHQHCSPSETPPPSPMTRRRASPIKADRNTRCPPPQALWTAETVPKGLYSTEAPGAAGVVASPAGTVARCGTRSRRAGEGRRRFGGLLARRIFEPPQQETSRP